MTATAVEVGATVAGRYELESVLGRGGMGAVFIARDTKFGEKMALKISTPTGTTYDEFKNRFIREARLGSLLGKTDGFVRAFDWGELPGGSLFLAMDLVPGAKPLDLKTGSIAERLQRLRTAARLVALAHKSGVIHRDIKPANFLQREDGRIFLADFGLAKSRGEVETAAVTSDLTNAGIALGTPAYMPPEQFADLKSVDERADVFALGVMLFSALADGHCPYEGTPGSIIQMQTKVAHGASPAPTPRAFRADVDKDLEALCTRALAVDLNARLPSADALVAGIDAFLTRTSRSSPAPATGASGSGGGPGPLFAVVAVVVALVVVGVVVIGVALGRKKATTATRDGTVNVGPSDAQPHDPSNAQPHDPGVHSLDPALVGNWESSAVLNNLLVEAGWTITADGQLTATFASAVTGRINDSGTFETERNHYKWVVSSGKLSEGGSYLVFGPNWFATRDKHDFVGLWRRGGEKTSPSNPNLSGTWRHGDAKGNTLEIQLTETSYTSKLIVKGKVTLTETGELWANGTNSGNYAMSARSAPWVSDMGSFELAGDVLTKQTDLPGKPPMQFHRVARAR